MEKDGECLNDSECCFDWTCEKNLIFPGSVCKYTGAKPVSENYKNELIKYKKAHKKRMEQEKYEVEKEYEKNNPEQWHVWF